MASDVEKSDEWNPTRRYLLRRSADIVSKVRSLGSKFGFVGVKSPHKNISSERLGVMRRMDRKMCHAGILEEA